MELKVINEKIGQVRTAEGQVKTLVAELATAVVDRIHEHNDVDSANKLLLALTPINQKKMLAFFKAHAGHKIEEGILTKRLGVTMQDGVKVDQYKAKLDAYIAFMESGMNFWQWAVAKKEKVETPVTLEELRKRSTKLKEQMVEGLSANVVDKVTAFEMLTGGVFSFDDMQQVLAHMAQAEDAITKAATASVQGA